VAETLDLERHFEDRSVWKVSHANQLAIPTFIDLDLDTDLPTFDIREALPKAYEGRRRR